MRFRTSHLVVLAMLIAACSGSAPAATEWWLEATTSTVVLPASTLTTRAVATTTAAAAPTTTSGEPDVAWTAAEAERDVANYLAALAAEEYEVAAWSAHNNGIVIDEHEAPAETLERLCARGHCRGPYVAVADGPGLVDPDSGQASSTVTVAHALTGAEETFLLGTFEGQLIIIGVPPLEPSNGHPSLVDSLFGRDVPERVVVERFRGFEIWDDGTVQWLTHWDANDTTDVEGDVIVADGMAGSLTDPAADYGSLCGGLMSRDEQVIALSCDEGLLFVATGAPAISPVRLDELGDGEFEWFAERGGMVIHGVGDAEGNSTSIHNADGVDLLGHDYAGYTVLSTDGDSLAYTEHRDPAAISHFLSPVVVIRSTIDGREMGRWTFDHPVIGVELSDQWLVVWLASEDWDLEGPTQIGVAAVDLDTGRVTTVETGTRVFLPS